MGTLQPFVAEPIEDLMGFAFDAAGNLYAESGYDVRVFDARGRPLGRIEGLTAEEREAGRRAEGGARRRWLTSFAGASGLAAPARQRRRPATTNAPIFFARASVGFALGRL